ncbi:LOW QUALITY PROTEIN: beta-1,3-galactosyltransferase 2-like [Mycteria americana]|uniref:LOW QUALITY PROTEIN: beta-1,3-galactosyltransferase 2-like n=1 Tax=Mycteria americana TaxID=33587 RepID=UPI003F58A3B7
MGPPLGGGSTEQMNKYILIASAKESKTMEAVFLQKYCSTVFNVFAAIYLIFYFLNSDHLAVLTGSRIQNNEDIEEKDILFTKRSTSTWSFKFIINEKEKCKDKTPFLILLISTTAAEIQHRSSIRKTWGNESVVHSTGVEVVQLFMLDVESKGPNEVLLRESEQYHDIIQQDFLDTYNNLTHKTLMGMKWVASYCSGASFVMKTDSDVFVNTIYLIEKLLRPLSPPPQNYFTGCLMKGHKPIWNKESKWYISEEEYPGDKYPPFCSGTGYVFSGDLASKIVNVSVMVKFIHLEDVYVGLCLDAKGIQIVPPPSHSLFNRYKVPFSPCLYNNIITSHYIWTNEHILYWEALQKKNHMSDRTERPIAESPFFL